MASPTYPPSGHSGDLTRLCQKLKGTLSIVGLDVKGSKGFGKLWVTVRGQTSTKASASKPASSGCAGTAATNGCFPRCRSGPRTCKLGSRIEAHPMRLAAKARPVPGHKRRSAQSHLVTATLQKVCLKAVNSSACCYAVPGVWVHNSDCSEAQEARQAGRRSSHIRAVFHVCTKASQQSVCADLNLLSTQMPRVLATCSLSDRLGNSLQ